MIDIIPNWHPLLVHFTIALVATAVALFVIGALCRTHRWRGQWLSVANWNLWIGAVFTVLTVLAGWYAYNTVDHDTPSHAAMTTHRNWALATAAVILALAAWSVARYRAAQPPHAPFLALALITAGLLLTTGWHGAEAVYRYGLGVHSLPQAEGDGHAHEHDTAHGEAMSEAHGTEPGAGATMDEQHEAAHPASEGRVHTHADGTVERH